MHRYSVEFRVTGDNLDPAFVTASLGLKPTTSWKPGECANPRNAEGLWGFAPAGGEWDSLEDGLVAVLRVLTPLKQRIDSLARDYDMFFWCGHFSSSFDGGPSFSPDLLKQLADFGVTLYLDSYVSNEGDS